MLLFFLSNENDYESCCEPKGGDASKALRYFASETLRHRVTVFIFTLDISYIHTLCFIRNAYKERFS